MSIEARKIEFVQEFLKLQNEELLSQLEKVLMKEKCVTVNRAVEPMTEDELNKRIDQSEADFKKNRFKSSAELLAK